MNASENDSYQDNDDDWSWTVAPAISAPDGRIWTKVVGYDGEYSVSYIYEHPSISQPASLLYEIDDWLADLWRTPSGHLYTMDEAGQVHIYDGKRWSVTQTGEKSLLTCVWGLDDKSIYATAKGVILQRTEGRWTYATKGHKNSIDRLRGLTDNTVYAVGRRGLMLHFDGRKWHRIDVPTNLHLNAVCAVSADTIYAVGAEGIVLKGAGTHWLVYELGTIDLLDVVAFQEEIYVAAGHQGLFRLGEGELVEVRSDINAVRLTSNDHFLDVAGGLSIHQFDGKQLKSYLYTV